MSPFLLPRVFIWSPCHSKFGPDWVPILKKLGPWKTFWTSLWLCFRDITTWHYEGSEGVEEEACVGWGNWLQQNGNCWKVPEEYSPSQHKNKKSFRFPAELLQLIFFYLPLGDLKTLVLVCKRWNVGERSKLWEKSFLLSKERSQQNSHSCPIGRQRKISYAKMWDNWK